MTLRGEWGAEGRFLGTPALSRRAPKGPFLIKNPGLPRENPVPLFPPLHQGRAWEMTGVWKCEATTIKLKESFTASFSVSAVNRAETA